MTSELEVSDLAMSFGRTRVLEDVTFSVPEGTAMAVVGPSGCGKTTLLRLIAGFERPDSGSIALGGDVMSGERWVPAHRRSVGYVAQDGALFPHLSAGANIAFGLPWRRRRRARIVELLEMVSLDAAIADRRPDELSGGQQQRVALARSLARSPRLMLLDEPFSALDAGLRAATRKIVGDVLAKAGVTTILVTHDQSEALSFADQVAVMNAGRLIQIGAPREIYRSPVDVAVAEFTGDAIVLPAVVVDQDRAECELGTIDVHHTDVVDAARIMLRPEQLEIGDRTGGVSGEIVDVEYLGAELLVGIRVGGDHASPGTRIVVRTRGDGDFRPGDPVGIRVRGRAIVYPREPVNGVAAN